MMADLTPDDLDKYIRQTKWAVPLDLKGEAKRKFAESLKRDKEMEQQRFLSAVSSDVVRRAMQNPQTLTSINMFRRLERYRQGAVDAIDIGQAAGRPGLSNRGDMDTDMPTGFSPMDIQRIENRQFRKRARQDNDRRLSRPGMQMGEALNNQDPNPKWRTSDWQQDPQTMPKRQRVHGHTNFNRSAVSLSNQRANFNMLR
jgi:hypothetical protein